MHKSTSCGKCIRIYGDGPKHVCKMSEILGKKPKWHPLFTKITKSMPAF